MPFNRYGNRIVKQDVAEDARLNMLADSIPDFIQPSIQPVIIMQKKYSNIVKNGAATNATSQAIYTTPSDKDFYLTSIHFSVLKDATSTSLFSGINVVIEGIVLNWRVETTTLTAENRTVSLSFPLPIKLDRNSAITLINSTNVANITIRACITGYTSDSAGS